MTKWKYDPTNFYISHVVSEEINRVARVCEDWDEADQHRNGRLLSAAPELLEVVKQSVAAWTEWNSTEGDGSPEPEYIRAGRAIIEHLQTGEHRIGRVIRRQDYPNFQAFNAAVMAANREANQ
jgi:hypothetical protein